MSAGESAHDVARRQREKAARLERSAELWELGASGEVAVAGALATLPEGWVNMHDLAWPGRPRANLDHVVVGPGGVFVVDAKNWSGRIEVRDQVLMQNGRSREQTVASAAEATKAIQALIRTPAPCVGVLCFVRDEPMAEMARGVMVCSTTNLVETLVSQARVLSAEDVRRCAEVVLTSTDQRTASAEPRSASRRGTRSGASTSRRQPRKFLRAVAALVPGLLLLALLTSGGLAKIGEWTAEQFVEQVSPQDQPSESPTKPAKKRSKPRRNANS